MNAELPILVQELPGQPSEGAAQAIPDPRVSPVPPGSPGAKLPAAGIPLAPPYKRVPMYVVRPLFLPRPMRRGEFVQRLLTRLGNDLRDMFQIGGVALRHDDLAHSLFNPPLEEHRLSLVLALRQRTLRGTFLFVTFEALGRRLAFTPEHPEMWFELDKGERLAERATEVLTAHYRQFEKRGALPEGGVIGLPGKAWITWLNLSVNPRQQPKKKGAELAAIFGGDASMSGAVELRRVGRSLDALYPDELERAVLRGAEVTELSRLLSQPERPPVLLLGPRMGGKTTLLHEHVFLRREHSNSNAPLPGSGAPPPGPAALAAAGTAGAAWLLAPQRLISGMSYVGQWENRLLAILKHAKAKDLVLVFDDLPGLFQAGRTSQSDLNVAQVLKPFLERRDVRVVAEATPEVLALVQELDRGLADLFHILPVPEPGESDVWRMLIEVVRRCEGRHGCRFDLDVLPSVMDLMRRYRRESAFPGKAAEVLARLAGKYARRDVTRADALREFHLTSGLSVAFLDDHATLPREEVVHALSSEVIGQPDAVDAVADAISIAKARLNDPERPVGTFLFLGPTGVGKTQCAKSLAKYLFGDAERLLRFDMNALVDRDSVPRLVGTLYEPEGLLTSAVRRQPFGVVLFDEIEKAHPDVFDLLLQVLGEGRLTDALGRTVDFTNTIIILTSNLGVREASSEFGFGLTGDRGGRGEAARQQQEEQAYIHAAERFFRPEFFNRIDRVVPFRRLSRGDTEGIARGLIAQLFERDGLIRRRCVLHVHKAAMTRIVNEGYHPQLGARALKRSLERQLTHPIAARLGELASDTPTVISVYPGHATLAVEASALNGAQRSDWPPPSVRGLQPAELLDRVNGALDRIDGQSQRLRPRGEVRSGAVTAAHTAYFALREQLTRVDALVSTMERLRPSTAMPNRVLHGAPKQRHGLPQRRPAPDPRMVWKPAPAGVWREVFTAEDMDGYLKTLATPADLSDPAGLIDGRLVQLLQEVALLGVMLDQLERQSNAGTGGELDRVLLRVEALTGDESDNAQLVAKLYGAAFSLSWGTQVADAHGPGGKKAKPRWDALAIEGPAAVALARAEVGTHLFMGDGGALQPIRVEMSELQAGEEPQAALGAAQRRHGDWLAGVAAGTARISDDPNPLRPTLRLYDPRQVTVDFRSGLMTRGLPAEADLYTFMLSQLPLPQELREES